MGLLLLLAIPITFILIGFLGMYFEEHRIFGPIFTVICTALWGILGLFLLIVIL